MPTEEFRRFADPLPEPMLLAAPGGAILAANRAALRRTGAPDLAGRQLADIAVAHTEDLAAFLRACARTAEPTIGTLSLREADGTLCRCRVEGALVAARARGASAVVQLRFLPRLESAHQFVLLTRQVEQLTRAVAARRQAEQALQLSRSVDRRFEERLTALLAIGNELSTLVSVDAVCRRAVELGRERLGFDRLSIWFRSPDGGMARGSFGVDETGQIRDERPSRIDTESDELMARVLTGRHPSLLVRDGPLYDHRLCQVGTGWHAMAALWDGARVTGFLSADNLVSGAPLADEQPRLLWLYAAMIGHLCSLKRAGEQLRFQAQLLDAIGQAVVATDVHDTVTYWNGCAERVFGWERDEALGRKSHELIGAPGQEGEAAKVRDEVLAGSPWNGERTLTGRDGTPFAALVTETPVLDDAGRPVGIIGVTADITDRLRAEQTLAHNQEHIALLNERLQEAMRETHHRVKNNLQVIAAMLDMRIMDGGAAIPIAEIHRLSSHVRALAIVHDLLTEHLDVEEGMRGLSARDVLTRLVGVLRNTAGAQEVQLGEVEDVWLTSRQGSSLGLVVNELVANGLKHGDGRVVVALTAGDRQARLDVIDGGPGFPPGFEPMAAASTGLELVERLSRWDLAGATNYGNAPDGGGRVTVTFPLDGRRPAPTTGAAAPVVG
ncbi:MAG: PAS domain S-box protein [Chthonomonadales bacterium]|nr:PAS domain S-box protein [Chthonomonadales bacterium]